LTGRAGGFHVGAMVAAVIFDCDGVLVDSEVLAFEAEFATLAAFGVQVEREDYVKRCLGLNDAAWLAALQEHYPAIVPHTDAFYARAKAIYRASLESDRLRAIDGAARAVGAVTTPKAVASSSAEAPLLRKLARTALLAHFDPHV
jgi:beta-phosphoglucomutase-like phosphatase (HAD superfamily)